MFGKTEPYNHGILANAYPDWVLFMDLKYVRKAAIWVTNYQFAIITDLCVIS